ncbi:MAG: FAD:protein FMN transferase, partial [Bacteroidales bacterium]|nr:FAD:protein FMN transferase [Bacteroidales bacterium]
MKKIIFFIFALSCIVSACNRPQLQRISLAGETQGTYYSITYYDAQGRNLQAEVDSVLNAVDQSVSLWVDQSLLSRTNEGDTTVELDSIFLNNFYLSKEVGILTNGYFDFTIGPLAQAWGFHRKQKREMLPEQVDSLKKLVDYRKV